MKILLVDDDLDSRTAIEGFLTDLGHQVVVCRSGSEALKIYKDDDFPMVLTDIQMQNMSGLELLQEISGLPSSRDTDVVLFTGHGDIDTAVAALRAGAYDYLLKPINVEELAVITERIAEDQALRRENRALNENLSGQVKEATEVLQVELTQLRKIVSQSIGLDGIGLFSDTIRQIVKQAQQYHLDRSIPVLIEGETGTGKEVIAKVIHFGELKNPSPFIDINCAALTPTLFESELFGYESGAFTGGLAKGQKGKLDLAKGGTLFLDEVGEIPLELQGKLLRVIQEKEFYRVGGLAKIKTDVRIICSTNADLEKAVEQGKFRKDLYYRLKVGHLVIPPLRRRKEEIVPLADLFLKEFSTRKGKKFRSISQEAARMLKNHCWPGNVRELKNLIEWVTFMYDEEKLRPLHLKMIERPDGKKEKKQDAPAVIDPIHFSLPPGKLPLEEYTDQIVARALENHRGNKTETARYLGISRRSLYSRLNRIKADKDRGGNI